MNEWMKESSSRQKWFGRPMDLLLRIILGKKRRRRRMFEEQLTMCRPDIVEKRKRGESRRKWMDFKSATCHDEKEHKFSWCLKCDSMESYPWNPSVPHVFNCSSFFTPFFLWCPSFPNHRTVLFWTSGHQHHHEREREGPVESLSLSSPTQLTRGKEGSVPESGALLPLIHYQQLSSLNKCESCPGFSHVCHFLLLSPSCWLESDFSFVERKFGLTDCKQGAVIQSVSHSDVKW